MRIAFLLMVFLTVFAGFSASSFAQGQSALKIEGLGWLAGCWELRSANGTTITEQWMKPAGGVMIGMSRTVSSGKTSAWEFMRVTSDSGKLSFIARPHTNSSDTVFPLVRSTASEAIFENAGHDFPQRVIYRNAGPNTLFARIEGTINGKASGMDFPMKRIKCEQ